MTVTDDPEHKYQRTRNRIDSADIPEREKQQIYDFLKAIHPEITEANFRNRKGQHETKSIQTVVAYGQSLKRVNELSDKPLSEFADTDEVNGLFNDFLRGTHPNVKDSGYSKQTMGQWQSAVTKFFEHYDELGIDPSEIAITPPPETEVDERDMFTQDDVEKMRDAITNARDRCLLELFLNTGQRIRAIQTLRVKDVDPTVGETGVYYLNTSEAGLKGADKNGKKRPLLGAKRPVKDWLDEHLGGPEDYLITSLPTANRGNHGEKLSQDNIRKRLRVIIDDAGVNKPANPHNFRHYFVTACKRDYGMDDATIKHLIGHGQDSNIMSSTYQHLTDDDHIEDAEIATGNREEEQRDSPLTPQVCPTCGDNLSPDAKACGGCGTVFTPDAQAAREEINQKAMQGMREAESEEEAEAVETMRQYLKNNPEEAVEILQEEL